jgi:hypothetical protein
VAAGLVLGVNGINGLIGERGDEAQPLEEVPLPLQGEGENRRDTDCCAQREMILFSSVGPDLKQPQTRIGAVFEPILGTAPQFQFGHRGVWKKLLGVSQLALCTAFNRGI